MNFNDFSNSISGRFKNNKFILPAIVGGALIGGYFLLKSGSNSPNAPLNTSSALDPTSQGNTSSGGGGVTQGADISGFTDDLTKQVSDFISGQTDTLAGFQSQIESGLDTNNSFYEQITDYVNQAVESFQGESRLTGMGDSAGVSGMDYITQPITQLDTYDPVDFSSVTPVYFNAGSALKTGVSSNTSVVAGSKSLSRSLSGVTITPRNVTNVGVSKPAAKPVKTVVPKVNSSPIPSLGINPKYGFQTVRTRLNTALVKPVSNPVKKTVKKK